MSSTGDKIKGKANEAVGNVKQAVGKATDNDKLRAEGKALPILILTARGSWQDKVVGLEAAGIRVAERLPIILPANPHNERYLATKRDRTGHQL